MKIYRHATPYKSAILANGFNTNHSYKERNEQLGAGQAIYFTESLETAERYLNASANESFLPIIIEEIKEHDNIAGFLLENLYKFGYEKAWEILESSVKEIYTDYDTKLEDIQNIRNMINSYEDKEYDLNDVGTISEYIRGSKTIEADDNNLLMNGASYMPENIYEDASNMGAITIPQEAEILNIFLDENAKIKEVGDTYNSVKEAELAKKEGYDGILFQNQYSINDEIELAIFNTDVIKFMFEVQENIKEEDITLILIESILDTLEKIEEKSISNIKNILITENGLLMDQDNINKSFRNILSALYKLKIIDIEPGNKIKTLVTPENVYTHLLIVNLNNDMEELKERIIKDRKYTSNTRFYDKQSNTTIDKKRPTLF